MRGLKSLGKPGPKSKLTEKNKQKIKTAILKGPRTAGYSTNIWTLSRIASLIRKLTRKTFKTTQTWRIVVSLGFTCQKPAAKNKERDEAEIKNWKLNVFPGLKKWAAKHRYLLGFHDESGVSERPTVRKTWSLKGKTPVI